MYNPSHYEKNNGVQIDGAIEFLDKHASKIKCNKGTKRVIDIGCGDGTVTNILKTYLPPDHKLHMCDVSEKMVNHAKATHDNGRTSFVVLDIEGEVPDTLKDNFDYAFGFNVLQWVADLEGSFKNIYSLLDDNGRCFTIFTPTHLVYEAYKILLKRSKWNSLLSHTEEIIYRVQVLQEPVKEVTTIMERVGFTDIDVECKPIAFVYDDMQAITQALIAINPFEIPQDMYDDFVKEYMEVLQDLRHVEKASKDKSSKKFQLNYMKIAVYGRKPSRGEI